MSTYETKDNTGSLFKNSRKEKDTHPDYTGQGRINGNDMWFSAWLKTDKNGNKFFSMAFKQKDGSAPPSRGGGGRSEAEVEQAVRTKAAKLFPPDDDFGDSVPF